LSTGIDDSPTRVFSTPPGQAEQVLSGVAPGGHELLIGFEDLPSASGDDDFQDVVAAVHLAGSGNLVL
jgi:hypothetical protein